MRGIQHNVLNRGPEVSARVDGFPIVFAIRRVDPFRCTINIVHELAVMISTLPWLIRFAHLPVSFANTHNSWHVEYDGINGGQRRAQLAAKYCMCATACALSVGNVK